jgi:uncharacterized protein involved in propanediol utilization
METTWLEFAKQAPHLTVLVFIVVTFLRHIKDGEKERAAHEIEKQRGFSEVIDRNTIALERNSEMFGRAAHVFDGREGPVVKVNGRH